VEWDSSMDYESTALVEFLTANPNLKITSNVRYSVGFLITTEPREEKAEAETYKPLESDIVPNAQ
jgi:hypothetical protein